MSPKNPHLAEAIVMLSVISWILPAHSAEAVMPAPGDWAFSEPPPYSCRLLYDEQKKRAYGDRSNGREIERLTKECLRDGGRP